MSAQALTQSARQQQLLRLAERDIEQDCTDYQALQRLMFALYEQLLARDTVQIEQLNQQILVLVEFTRERAERRSKILGALRLGYAQGAMASLFELYPETRRTQLTQRWIELSHLIQNAKALNERNGKLLAMHNDILSQLLGSRQGEQVYSPRYY